MASRLFPIGTVRILAVAAGFCVTLLAGSCRSTPAPAARVFATPEDAVAALLAAATGEQVDALVEIFGPAGRALIDTSDPTSARRARQVFIAAAAEQLRLVDGVEGSKTLVVGQEDWPFPVPLVRGPTGWRFDAAVGAEEIVVRRIGRNELSVIGACETYVRAQHLYARDPHDGRPAGAYAAVLRSAPGTQNGLYWPATRGGKRSPLGDLLAEAAESAPGVGQHGAPSVPFHGYYFRILTAQGRSAPGGAMDYIVKGTMTRGFALVAWPAGYDVTGVMTFLVGSDGVVRQKDLGPDTHTVVRAMTAFDPDASWAPAH
jgi:hypothetical protein